MPTQVGSKTTVPVLAPPKVGGGGGVSTAGQPIGLLLALTKAS